MAAPDGLMYGPYRVVRSLGSGGMGTVLLAEDPRLGRFVALKTFSGADKSGPFAREQLLREARAAAGVSNPHIAAVHDVLDIGGEVVIVFEYVVGETLATRLQRGRLPLDEALRIAIEVADALASAHAQGVVHRDLKPANVMLTSEGHAKILDFGIARTMLLKDAAIGGRTSSVTFAGTPGYAAPEQWLGEAVGTGTDIFALGVLLFEMLTGRRPYRATTRLELFQKMISDTPPRVRELNPDVPESLDRLVAATMQRDPADRPATAREVRETLRAIARDPQTSISIAVRPKRRLRRRLIAAGIGLFALIAALVGSLGRSGTPPAKTVPVVAVLPLANATGSAGNDYLAAGIADSLTVSLASMNGITVLSRAAVSEATRRGAEPAKLARELGANYLVEGSVQQSGEIVRLNANLVREDQSVAWAETVEGSMATVFELQSRLAAAVGRALSVQLSAADRARLAELPTTNSDALAAYWRGRALLERRDVKGNADAALAAFDEAVTLDPRFAIAHAARGEALWARYIEARDPQLAEEAIAAGTTALRLDPQRANVRYSLALALSGSGRLDDAIEELQRALALQPNYDDARRELGNILARKGRLDEAIAEFRKAITLRPNYWEHYSALGLRLFQAAKYDEAAEAFKRSIELQPDNYMGYQQLGTVYQALGRNDEALANYQRALSIRPSAAAYSNIGALLHARGDYGGAIEAYKKAIELRPNSHMTHRNLGDAYQRLGRRRDAVRSYERAAALAEADLNVNRNDADTMGSLAVYLAKSGDLAAAAERMAAAKALAPNDVQVLYTEAVVHALGGRRQQALVALKAALDRGYSRQIAANEEDFETLRSDPEFVRLTADAMKEKR